MTILEPLQVQIVKSSEVNVELILSIIAIIISVVSIIMQRKNSKDSVRVSLEADYYLNIYKEYLMEKIPKACQVIRFSDEKLLDVDSLIDELNNMRRASLFFKYYDEKFYEEIYDALQNLENKLVSKSGDMSNENYAKFIPELNQDITSIYDIINSRYLGKKKNEIRKWKNKRMKNK